VLAEERQAILLQKLQDNGYVQVAEMAAMLKVSVITIRRDLERMENGGQCIRTRGGAVCAANSTTLELPYDIKRSRYIEEKRRIAAAAAKLVGEGETIILDGGSTTYELALLLLRRRALTVVTNDLQIATKLASSPSITLVCTGGIARANVYTLQGPQVESLLRTLRVNKAFLSADAIHPDGGIANVNLDEVAVKQAIVKAAKQVILLADSSKFATTGFVTFCDLSEIDLLITDSGIQQTSLDMLKDRSVAVTLV